MFNPMTLIIETFAARMQQRFDGVYGQHTAYRSLLPFVVRLTLEHIANGDAAYHDAFHTCNVAEVGSLLLLGKQMREGGVTPADWAHALVAMLCHDIGYVRGVCQGDGEGAYVINAAGDTVRLQPGATDAAMTPYHVDRSILFVQQRFATEELLDERLLMQLIEYTRFPVQDVPAGAPILAYAELVRAADLIGQLADVNYARKSAALYAEFAETGMAEKFGYTNAADLRRGYPRFFWNHIAPHIQRSLRYLHVTQEGKDWLGHLYANVFAEEHEALALGAERWESTGRPAQPCPPVDIPF